ncbi:MAG: AAA family ATPase [Algiphilus sp.]
MSILIAFFLARFRVIFAQAPPQAPIVIRNLRVQHYKSLSNIDVSLGPLTLLVGPNGSGKSNLVDALRFIRDSVAQGIDHAINDRGGIDIIRQFSRTRPYIITFEITFDLDSLDDIILPHDLAKYSGHTPVGYYALKIGSKRGDFFVQEETASWPATDWELQDDHVEPKAHINAYSFHRNSNGDVYVNNEPARVRALPNQLAIPSFSPHQFLGGSIGQLLLRQLRFSAIYPNVLREPKRPDTERRLREDCSNWASVIRAMRQRDQSKRSVDKVLEYMEHVMPELENVTVKNVGGYLVPQFLIQEKRGSTGHYFDPIQLSDGTLRLFAILLALYQAPNPPFLAIEEPEQTVHPGVLALLAEAFHEVANHTQLLITTHSPYMLDHVDPHSIRVVNAKNGETQVSKIKDSQVKAVQNQLMSMSEIMHLDGLLPDHL